MVFRRARRFILISIFLLISAGFLVLAGARLSFVAVNAPQALQKKVAVPELIPLSPREEDSGNYGIRYGAAAGGPQSEDFPTEQIDYWIGKLQSQLQDVRAADDRQNKRGRLGRAGEKHDSVLKGEIDSIEALITVAGEMRRRGLEKRERDRKTRENFTAAKQELSETQRELLKLRSEIESARTALLSDIANRPVTSIGSSFGSANADAKTDLTGLISAVAGVASLLVACFVWLKGDAVLDRLSWSSRSSDVRDFITAEETQGEPVFEDDAPPRAAQVPAAVAAALTRDFERR